MANLWFKFYGGEFLSDPKIERLSPLERSCWVTLLCLASMSNDGEIEFLTIESLLNKSGIQFDPYRPEEWNNALSVLSKFQQMKMVELFEDGIIKILNWEKRQEHNLTPAERMAKMRAKNKSVTSDVTDVTLEKSRVEENRIDKEEKDSPIFKKINYLSQIPEQDLKEFHTRFDCSQKQIKDKAESLKLYCQSKGKAYKDYKAFLLNALKKDFQERVAKQMPVYVQSLQTPLSDEQLKSLEEKKREISKAFGRK
jgi:hypothetical protein